MILRGNKQGGKFYGCKNFPNCRGSRTYGKTVVRNDIHRDLNYDPDDQFDQDIQDGIYGPDERPF